MAATHPASFSPTSHPPQLNCFSPGGEGETQGQTYHNPRLTGGKTHKPGVRVCLQVKAATPHSSLFPSVTKWTAAWARGVGNQSGPLGQLLAHPIWLREMLNSPCDWKVGVENEEKRREFNNKSR